MAGEFETEVNDMGAVDLPYGKDVRAEEIVYESGMRLLRLRIKEGRRHTVLEVDPASAAAWSKLMGDWAETNSA